MNIVIKAENVGKKYNIGYIRNDTMRDAIASIFKKKSVDLRINRLKEKKPEFWALRNVSFDIEKGNVVGIIGRNGAGKSTLLKILSRITEPTEGSIKIKGRVSSLLEVGTGFHPELTGRENIYLNGSLLGMSKKEIHDKFEEIVNFSEIEKFLDTPVKRYSSGMYVRLAFAVAAHLEPEILIVDEVLSVGDAAFQKKCMGKMDDVSKSGKTVLFVSHNMGAIAALSNKAILIHDGNLVDYADVESVIQKYISLFDTCNSSLLNHPGRATGYTPHIINITICSKNTKSEGQVFCGDSCNIIIETINPITNKHKVSIGIYDGYGVPISHLSTDLVNNSVQENLNKNELKCRIDQLNIAPGNYYINVALTDGSNNLDHITRAKTFQVIESNFLGRGILPSSTYAKVILKHEWFFNEEQV